MLQKKPETEQVSVKIGGFIQKGTPLNPVKDAVTRLLDKSGALIRETKTDEDGAFAFHNLRPGNFTLEVYIEGKFAKNKTTEVPSKDGDYTVVID